MRDLFIRIDDTGGFIGRIAWTNKDFVPQQKWGEVTWLGKCWWGELPVIRQIFCRPT
jgi:hypothetical protein